MNQPAKPPIFATVYDAYQRPWYFVIDAGKWHTLDSAAAGYQSGRELFGALIDRCHTRGQLRNMAIQSIKHRAEWLDSRDRAEVESIIREKMAKLPKDLD